MFYRTMLILVAGMLLFSVLPAQSQNLHWIGEPEMSKDFFPIMTWTGLLGQPRGGREGGLESIAECNFTVAGFVDAIDLPKCEKLGLKAIVHLPEDVAPWNGNLEEAPDDVINNTIRQRIESIGNSKAVIGYYVADEPKEPRFVPLSKKVAAIKEWAPGKLAFINLLPGSVSNSRTGASSYTNYLEQFITETKPQILSYDNYDVIYSDSGQNSDRFWRYIWNLAEVRRVSLERGIPFWNIVCCMRIRPYTTVPSPSNLMLQAYTTLAAGAHGIIWWRYHVKTFNAYGPIEPDGNRTNTWDYLRMVNGQIRVLGPIMNHLKSTGIFFSSPPDLENILPLPGRIVQSVESVSSTKGYGDAKPPVMVGEFLGDDGCDYAMVVNLSMEKPANIKVKTRKAYSTMECISSRNGSASAFDKEGGQWLVPGQGVLIKFSGSEASKLPQK